MERLKTQSLPHRGAFELPDLWIHAVLLLSGLAALFFLLTNGVPLVQAGWMHELGKKGRYVRLMLISVPIFAVLMLVTRWKFREIFDQSCWVKWWQAV
ncbi:MAG: hypothetical protein WCJ71_09310, partial [Candidatus Omnitrophota bacterium]